MAPKIQIHFPTNSRPPFLIINFTFIHQSIIKRNFLLMNPPAQHEKLVSGQYLKQSNQSQNFTPFQKIQFL